MQTSRPKRFVIDLKNLLILLREEDAVLLTQLTLSEDEILANDSFFIMKANEIKKFWNDGHLVPEFFAAFEKNTSITDFTCSGFTKKNEATVAKLLHNKIFTKLTLDDYEKVIDGVRDTLDLTILANHLRENPLLESVILKESNYTARFTVKNANQFISALRWHRHPSLTEFNIAGTTALFENQEDSKEDKREEKNCLPQEKLAGMIFQRGMEGTKVKKTGIEDILLYPDVRYTSFPEFNEIVRQSIDEWDKELRSAKTYSSSGEDGKQILTALLEDKEANVFKLTKKQKDLFNDSMLEADKTESTYFLTLKAYTTNYLSLKIRKYNSSTCYYIVLTSTEMDTLKKPIKYYYLSKPTPTLLENFGWLLRFMPPRDLELPTIKKIRMKTPAKPLSFWDSEWEETPHVHNRYVHGIDPMVLHVIDENFKISLTDKKIIITEMGSGKARLAAKVIENLIGKGFKVEYHLLEPSKIQCELAKERMTELQKIHGDTLTYHIINKTFNEVDCRDLEGKVNLFIASGVFTLNVRDRFFTTSSTSESKESDVEKDMRKSVSLLATDAIMIHVGLCSSLFIAKEYEAFGLTMLRKTYGYKDYNGNSTLWPCYVGQKTMCPALELDSKSEVSKKP